MARTERINLLVSPKEKASYEKRARALKIGVSELVRRAVDTYAPGEEDVQALADELAAVVDATDARVDQAMGSLETLKAFLDSRAELRVAARAAIEAQGAVWPFTAIDSDRNGRDSPS